MKAYKTITILTIIIFIIILCVISFAGLYVLKDYKARDVIKDYQFGKEYSKSRVIELTADDVKTGSKILDEDGNEVTEREEGVEYTEENGYTIIEGTQNNLTEDLTKDNFKKSKKIIQTRLKKLSKSESYDIGEYDIKFNEQNGTITVDVTETDSTDDIIPILLADGTFELQDSETGEVLLSNSDIKSVNKTYSQVDQSTIVAYLQIAFNKDGAKKLEEISKTYVETKAASKTEDGEEIPAESKDVTLYINGEQLMETHFGDQLTNGVLGISMGSGSTKDSLKEADKKADKYIASLSSGVMPLTYEETNHLVIKKMDLFKNKVVLSAIYVVAIIAFLVLVIKLKLKGLLAAILEVGYIALLLLAIRYTNVKITLYGIIGIGVMILINYYYLYRAFKKTNSDFIKDITKKIAFVLIPVYVLAIVFTFSNKGRISSLGMSLVWGIIVMYLYNLSLTQIAVKTLKD